jgi:hypothetical protein
MIALSMAGNYEILSSTSFYSAALRELLSATRSYHTLVGSYRELCKGELSTRLPQVLLLWSAMYPSGFS